METLVKVIKVFSMTAYKKEIEAAASKFAESEITPDYNGFVNGAEWAFKTGIIIDGPSLTQDLVKLKDLHQRIFLGGQFTEKEAGEYEDLVTKYEGLDLMKLFGT